jgi:hypothetical protein
MADAVKFGDAGVMTAVQEVLFQELANQYWAEEAKKVQIHVDNLVFLAQVKAVLKGLM